MDILFLIQGAITRGLLLDLDQYKEKDLDFRKKLKAEIHKSRENLKNIIDELYEDGAMKKIRLVQKVIDELDLFSNDLSLVKMGHDSSLFSNRAPIEEEAIQRVVHFNKFIFEKIENITLSSEEIADMMIDEEEMSLARELKKIRQYVTKARNQFKKRNDLMKELKL
jgi:hypothetical protein